MLPHLNPECPANSDDTRPQHQANTVVGDVADPRGWLRVKSLKISERCAPNLRCFQFVIGKLLFTLHTTSVPFDEFEFNLPQHQTRRRIAKMSMSIEECQTPRPGFPKPVPAGPSNVIEQFSMKGKVIVVTGAAEGIGGAVADAMAEAGGNVALWYNSYVQNQSKE
jgi:hypothetical protein